MVDQVRQEFLRSRSARNAEPLQLADTGQIAVFYFRQQVGRVGGHAHQKGRARLNEAIDQTGAAREIVDNELAAGGERHDHGAETQVMT
jgi:hypothetical protein